MGDFEDTRFSWLQNEREARSLAEAFPQQAESLAAVVRKFSRDSKKLRLGNTLLLVIWSYLAYPSNRVSCDVKIDEGVFNYATGI